MDLIDRQALLKQIDIDSDGEPGYYGDTWKFIDTIKSLPSATDKNVGTKLGTNLAEVGTDCISRKAAIDVCDNAIDLFRGQFGAGALVAIKESIEELPFAQPEPIRINLNEPIKVKLTDWGKEIYYHQYDRANQIAGREICKPKFPKEDENGYTEFQLWCFIELYGMHMGMTLPNVIEPLEIVYER